MPTVHQDQQETGTTTLTFAVPGAADVGGYAIVEITTDNSAGVVPTPGQAGWTEAFSNTAAVDHRSSFFVRYIDATPPANWTFTVEANSGGRLVVVMPEAGETFSAVDYAGTDNVSNVTSSTTGTGVANVADPRIFLGFWTQDSVSTVASAPLQSDGSTPMTIVGTVHGSSGSTTSGACYYEEDPTDVGDITRTLVWTVQDTVVAFGALVSFTSGGTAYTLTADPGDLALIGTAAFFDRVVAADPGVFSFSGTDATLTLGTGATAYELEADPGTFQFLGTDATLAHGIPTEGTGRSGPSISIGISL